MPGKTALSEASSLTEEAVHAKLVHFASGHMPGRDKLAESLTIERMEWTTDRMALRVWFQSRPEEDVLACIASEGSEFLFGEGWGGRVSPVHAISLLEVIAMDAPKANSTEPSFATVWDEIDVETGLDTTLRSNQGIQRRGGRRLVALTCQQAPYTED
jgi:hypothetical protein